MTLFARYEPAGNYLVTYPDRVSLRKKRNVCIYFNSRLVQVYPWHAPHPTKSDRHMLYKGKLRPLTWLPDLRHDAPRYESVQEVSLPVHKAPGRLRKNCNAPLDVTNRTCHINSVK